MLNPVVTDMPPAVSLDARLQADLRSDHAGETGAVWIYKGILAVSRTAEVRAFAREHLQTEHRHLAFFEQWLPASLKSRILALWRLAGWTLGALAALGGKQVVFHTIEAVESFVVQHYQEQIDYLGEQRQHRDIRAVLHSFLRDEDHHRLDALDRSTQAKPGLLARGWRAAIGRGSRLAVVAARRL